MKAPQGGIQATDVGDQKIKVILHDVVNDTYSEPVFITKAKLAKLWYYNNVVARNGKFIIELNQ